VYFLISEENMKRMLRLPYVTVGSDGASIAPTPTFEKFGMVHPRTYGTFARVLGKYVREDSLFSLEEAVHRMSALPALRLGLQRRGELKPGNFADLVVFNPATIQDHATFTDPHQFATGVVHVFVNGKPVLANGEHTGAKPGRIIRNKK
jgi:N-acyl-D-amino-acid deacylase